MARMRMLSELPEGQINFEGFCLVRSCAVRTNVKGTPYLDLVLADCEGEAVAKVWDYDPKGMGTFESEDIIKVRGVITTWKDTEQLKIDRIRHAVAGDDYDLSLLTPCAPFDSEWLYDELYALAGNFESEDLRMIVQYLMREHRDALVIAPAAVKLHHATRGGLLHHCWTIVQLAKGIASTYPLLDFDLIAAGAILHDIGKLFELDTGKLGIASAYTTSGQLLGHINIGVAIIGEAGQLLGVGEETVMLLQHMLLSHHEKPEFGSPKPPMFPEAEVLSELDLMDSRLYAMFSALDGVQPGAFTERIWSLDNRMLYKKR